MPNLMVDWAWADLGLVVAALVLIVLAAWGLVEGVRDFFYQPPR